MHLTNYAVNKDGEDFIVPKSVNDDHAHQCNLTHRYVCTACRTSSQPKQDELLPQGQ